MCTIFAKNINGEVIVGRNFDYPQLGGNLHFIPSKRIYGIKTYKLSVIEQFGSDRPLDGINEAGLFMGLTGIENQYFNTESKNGGIEIDELGVIRFILERASNIDQAVELFKYIKVTPDYLEPRVRIQYLIIDKKGNYCTIIGNEVSSYSNINKTNFVAITNFPVQYQQTIDCERYKKIEKVVDSVNQESDLIDLMSTVSKDTTAYTSIYNLSSLTQKISIEKFYEYFNKFNLNEEITLGNYFYNFATLRLMLNKSENKEIFK